jgi:hypothetical protein
MNIEIGKFDVDEVGEENLMPKKEDDLDTGESKENNDDVNNETPPNPWVVLK